MKVAIPGITLVAEPHIKSMVHVWKRQYSFLSGLISKSGNSWNPIQKKVECTKESWDEMYKGYTPMRNKMDDPWPFYEDWIEIFGKDRATGDNSINFGEAANGVLNNVNEALSKDTVNEALNINAEISEFNETDLDKVNEDFLPTGDDCDTASGSGSNLVRKKRKAVSSICEDAFVEVVSNFVKKTDETLVQMVQSLAPKGMFDIG
ncbi:uncharacterized protein LOC130990801 [Salvia miltiorrhiza]|uniref:uncharacterized protein LOC130990801 n=1 Tax=Salvia miltiorrhiza TaxID=226208 RepID=UPI0025ACCC69|nr:uncharacterized protein LOC130990801 [Salvia miltiorrhiza]